jgi:hypothetical protein
MTRNRIAALAAAVALAVTLVASPAHAAGKSTKSGSLLADAWAWLYGAFCEENGHVIP